MLTLDDEFDFAIVLAVLVLRVAGVEGTVAAVRVSDDQFGQESVRRQGLEHFVAACMRQKRLSTATS